MHRQVCAQRFDKIHVHVYVLYKTTFPSPLIPPPPLASLPFSYPPSCSTTSSSLYISHCLSHFPSFSSISTYFLFFHLYLFPFLPSLLTSFSSISTSFSSISTYFLFFHLYLLPFLPSVYLPPFSLTLHLPLLLPPPSFSSSR